MKLAIEYLKIKVKNIKGQIKTEEFFSKEYNHGYLSSKAERTIKEYRNQIKELRKAIKVLREVKE